MNLPKHCVTLRLKYLCVDQEATIKIIDGIRTAAREKLLTMAPYAPGMLVCSHIMSGHAKVSLQKVSD